MRSTRPPATGTPTTRPSSTPPSRGACRRPSWTPSSAGCCGHSWGPISTACRTRCPRCGATTTRPRSTPSTSPGPARRPPGTRTTTACRDRTCWSSGTTRSAAPTTRTPCGAIPAPTSASMCSPGTARRTTADPTCPRRAPARRCAQRLSRGPDEAPGDRADLGRSADTDGPTAAEHGGGAMAEGVWLEVALNGPWTRQRQPGIPVTRGEIVEQAVACAGAGAAVVHPPAYAEGLGRAGLIEWSVVDPGSVTLATFAELRDGEDGFLYANSASDVRIGLELCGQHGLVPSYAIYEPGFLRTGAALRAAVPGSPNPVYRFMFSTAFTFGLPPTEWALDSYLRLLDASDPGAPWMIAGLGVELDGLWDAAMARGGHLRVGLEDAPPGCTRTNAEMVAEACRAVQQAGRPLATASEVRRATVGGDPLPSARTL